MDLTASAQRLACSRMSGFASVMHEQDGGLKLSLHLPQEGQQGCHFSGGVLINTMQTHERVEHDEPGLDRTDGVLKPLAVALEVESDSWGGNDMHVESVEVDALVIGDALEALPHHMKRILGCE